MSCGLAILGVTLDVDTFVEKTKMQGFAKSYKGEPLSPVNPRKKAHAMAFITTSEAGFDNVALQIEETTNFLIKNKDNLKHIKSTPGIDFATIDFGIDAEIDENKLTQSLYFPAKLIAICSKLGIGIEASLYHKKINAILADRYGKK